MHYLYVLCRFFCINRGFASLPPKRKNKTAFQAKSGRKPLLAAAYVAHLSGIEPLPRPPEGRALSIMLQVHTRYARCVTYF